MSDRTISRSSSSTSPRNRTAARRGAAPALFAALLSTSLAPARAADPCPPLSGRALLTAPQAGDLYLRPGAAACDRIAIEVVGRGLEQSFTIAFDVKFPPDLLVYDGYAAGGLFEQGPPRTAPLYLVRATAPGSVAVSMTRFAPDPAVGAEGDAVVVTLRFRRAAGGAGTVDFDPAPSSANAEQILGADGAVRAARFGPGHGVALTVP